MALPCKELLVSSLFVHGSTSLFGLDIFTNSFAAKAAGDGKYPIYGDESIMSKKEHGTSAKPVMDNHRYNVDFKTADNISNYNRHFAEYFYFEYDFEYAGYAFDKERTWLAALE